MKGICRKFAQKRALLQLMSVFSSQGPNFIELYNSKTCYSTFFGKQKCVAYQSQSETGTVYHRHHRYGTRPNLIALCSRLDDKSLGAAYLSTVHATDTVRVARLTHTHTPTPTEIEGEENLHHLNPHGGSPCSTYPPAQPERQLLY